MMHGGILCLIVTLLLLVGLELCHSANRHRRTKTRPTGRVNCQLSPDPGSCDERIRQWFYDPLTDDCKRFSWTGCEGNENRFWSRSQCKRICTGSSARSDTSVDQAKPSPVVAKCRRLPCKNLRCHHGYSMDVDANGCQTCQCMSAPTSTQEVAPFEKMNTCQPVVCQLNCPGGFEKDEHGCEICRCSGAQISVNSSDFTIIECPEAPCDLKCSDGYETDKGGCPKCACRESPKASENQKGCDLTKMRNCTRDCPGGFDRDALGCEVCECRPLADENSAPVGDNTPFACSPFDESNCAARCEHFVISRDENDCEFCTCPNDLKTVTSLTVPFSSPCPELQDSCTLDCSDGREVNENGCEICKCHQPEEEVRREHIAYTESISTRPECPLITCPSGCTMVQNTDCPACECEASATESSRTDSLCPDLNCEDLTCPTGHQVDSTGCSICACAEEIVDNGSAVHEVMVTLSPIPNNEDMDESAVSYTTWISSYFSEKHFTLSPSATDATDDGDAEEEDEFQSELMCNKRRCGKKCDHGLRRNAQRDCLLCECIHLDSVDGRQRHFVDIGVFKSRKDMCSLPPYKGPCRANLTRWYFNAERSACEAFEYGGCRGYANNFRSRTSCREFCVPEINEERATRQDKYKKVLGW